MLDDKICGCLDYDLKKGDDYLTVIPYLLKVSVLLADFDEDIKRKVVAVLCSAVTNYGEHSQVTYTASRPYQEKDASSPLKKLAHA